MDADIHTRIHIHIPIPIRKHIHIHIPIAIHTPMHNPIPSPSRVRTCPVRRSPQIPSPPL